MLKKHKSYLFSCYGWISQNMDRIKDREVLYYFHADGDINENVIGTVASMVLNSRILITIKPILAFTKTNDGFIKVSSRGTKELVEKGLNLGKVMSYASKKIGGEGGGHDIAAGAKIEKGKEEEFLKYAEEEIRRQIAHEGER
jgi:RecJ-like exonuclease